MPTFMISNVDGRSDDIAMRSIETEDLTILPPTSSPFTTKLSQTVIAGKAGKWTPISISSGSSDEDDEKLDKLDHSLKGNLLIR